MQIWAADFMNDNNMGVEFIYHGKTMALSVLIYTVQSRYNKVNLLHILNIDTQISSVIARYCLLNCESNLSLNRWVSQMRALLGACRELAKDYNTLPELLYVFEHKTEYILIHAPYTRTVVF